MEVAVIGSGIVGTLTAYYLRERGCQVTVYDKAAEAASSSSRANGGQLSYSFCDAMADPQLLSKLPGILLGMDPAFHITPSVQAAFIKWGISFIGQCRKTPRDANTLALLKLAQRSAELMQPLNKLFGEHARHARHGKLVLLNQQLDAEFERRLDLKRNLGLEMSVLSQDEIFAVEPALRNLTEPPVSAVYSPQDEAADAFSFTQCLAQSLRTRGVNTHYETNVKALVPTDNNRCMVSTDNTEAVYEAVVVATGTEANQLLRPHGIQLPILGMSGYSWTFPATEQSPKVSVTAMSKRIVFTRLGDRVRVAGFADINANPANVQARANTLRDIAAQVLPGAGNYDNPIGDAWHGLRAMTPNSRPILGATGVPGIYTNVGHGMLGWTLGAATSEWVAQEITQN